MFLNALKLEKKVCDKAVDSHLSVMQCVPERFKTQEMCDEAVDPGPFVFDFIITRFKTQKCVIKLFLKILLC